MSHVKITRMVLEPIHDGDAPRKLLSHEYLSEADRSLVARALRFYEDQGGCETEAEAQRAMDIINLLQHVNEWE
jgi:hypothetical protein